MDCPQCWRQRRDGPPPPKFRLPDGSTFHATYDAPTQTWTGSLRAGDVVVEESNSALHQLLKQLGQRLHRKRPVVLEKPNTD